MSRFALKHTIARAIDRAARIIDPERTREVPMVTVTPSALAQLQRMQQAQPQKSFRVVFRGFG